MVLSRAMQAPVEALGSDMLQSLAARLYQFL